LEAFLVSTGVVALAEMGDKTQLLAFILAARFRKPVPIIAGILLATLANHTIAGALGAWITSQLSPGTLRIALGISFLAMAAWTLVPDRFDEADARLPHASVIMTTIVAFFLAEMGDKTQVATAILASRFGQLVPVVAGTTLGMLIVDVPTVLFAGFATRKIPFKAIRIAAAVLFAILGVTALVAPTPG